MRRPRRTAGATGSPALRLLRPESVLTGRHEDELVGLITPRLDATGAPQLVDLSDPQAVDRAATLFGSRQAAQELLDASVAENTQQAYRTHVRAWAAWCADRKVAALPADPAEVALFLTAYSVIGDDGKVCRTLTGDLAAVHAPSSVHVRAAALAKVHRNAGLPSPTEDPRVQQVLAGIRRTFLTRPKHAKAAIDRNMLTTLVNTAAQPRREDLRRWATVLIHAYTGAGAAELGRLTWADIQTGTNEVALTFRGADGSQVRTHVVPSARDARLRLDLALTTWRGHAPHLKRVVVAPDGRGLSRQAIHSTLAAAARVVDGPLAKARTAALLQAHQVLVSGGQAKALRDAALLTLMWWAALRRDEAARLQWRDLTRRSDGHWALLIRRAKNDPEGHGATLYLPRLPEEDAATCPARAMDAWRAHVAAELGADPLKAHPGLPVLARVTRYGVLERSAGRLLALSGRGINVLVQDLVAQAGFTGLTEGGRNAWGAHSLRAGFVTEALRDGKLTVEEVQQITRHRSLDVLIRYRREIQGFATSPVHKLVSALELGA